MVYTLIIFQLGKPLEESVSSRAATAPVHPINVKVIIIGVPNKPICSMCRSPALGVCVQNGLPIYWSKHVSIRQKEVVFVFGHLTDYRISGLADVKYQFSVPYPL